MNITCWDTQKRKNRLSTANEATSCQQFIKINLTIFSETLNIINQKTKEVW